MNKPIGIFFCVMVLAGAMACDRGQPRAIHAPGLQARRAVVQVEPPPIEQIVAGQTLYVPAYSSIYTSDQAHGFNLAVTLSIRNTDRAHPIIVTTSRYYDQDGKILRDDVKTPLRIGPMASAEFFVKESDTSGGVSASFLVEWVALRPVSPPLVESLMIGTAGTQGVYFTCPGRVIADRHDGPGPAASVHLPTPRARPNPTSH